MARYDYGLTTADFAMAMSGRIQPGAVYTAWTARIGGTQILDLQTIDGVASTVVTADASGIIGFKGPDESKAPIWLDGGVGGRVAVRPVDITGAAGAPGGPGPAGPSQPTGDGSPEGVRAGNRGDVWVQKNHPVAGGGVLVWRKQTGADGSTTGWVVVEGDTGWFNVASLYTPSWGTVHTLEVRRIGGVAEMNLDVSVATNPGGNSAAIGSLPVGFRPASSISHDDMIVDTNAGVFASLLVRSGGVSIYKSGTPAVARYRGFKTFLCVDSWPTVAPA